LEATERDLKILKLANKFRFCLGKHIRVLAGFEGQRATDRRLKMLIDSGYLSRKKYMYGIPYLYTPTHKGRILLGANKREDKIRIDRIAHDIHVLDSVIFYVFNDGISLPNIETEKELHIKDGFGTRKHHPDFIIASDNGKIAVEVELNPKTKNRMENNVRDNYINFDGQVWITSDSKVISLLKGFENEYSNISILQLEKVLEYVRERYK